jgi:hypothetical protein
MPPIFFKVPAKEWLLDDTLNALGLEYKGAWGNLLAFCKLCEKNGKFINEVHEPIEQHDIIRKSRITAVHFNRFIACNMVSTEAKDGEIIYSIKNWLKYQSEYDRTKPYKNSLKALNIKTEKEKANVDVDVIQQSTPEIKHKQSVENLHPKSKYAHKTIKMSQFIKNNK